MTTKEFIEKAMEGGYSLFKNLDGNSHTPRRNEKQIVDGRGITAHCEMYSPENESKLPENKGKYWYPATFYMTTLEIILDPLSWQAVGKVEGWIEYDTSLVYSANESMDKMYKMIEHLEVIEGGTITSYLEKL